MREHEKPRRFTLDESIDYEIRVLGELEGDWSDWLGVATIEQVISDDIRLSVIRGTFDQAALHGVLRRLYSLGYPLVSVVGHRTAQRSQK